MGAANAASDFLRETKAGMKHMTFTKMFLVVTSVLLLCMFTMAPAITDQA